MTYEKHSRMVQFHTSALAIACAALLFSCSPTNRVSRILARNPHLAETQVSDTIYQDSFYAVDTLRFTQTDTFTRNDTTFIRTSDTIRLERRCPVIRQRETIYLQDTSKSKGKKPAKGRERPIRKEKPVREGFFERIERYMADGLMLFMFVIGYSIGGAASRFFRRFEKD